MILDRKRHYLVSQDFNRNPSDYEILNDADIYPANVHHADGTRHPVTAGARSFSLQGMVPTSYGLPKLRAKPKVFVALRNKPLDIYGFGTRRVVSDRAKSLLVEIDPTAFDFVKCDTITRKDFVVAPYWMVDIARAVDGIDEERSVFELAEGVDGITGQPYYGPHFHQLHDLHLSSDTPPEFHAMLLKQFRSHMIFDEVIVDAWRALRFSGAAFLPLQPPTQSEITRLPVRSYWRPSPTHP
ncbi:MAG: DUF1629 domain-containing protein [Burkholderiales bacterium]|nr:MAG: DUF1629 domain-containing protein [Burkholderiales bacterium]